MSDKAFPRVSVSSVQVKQIPHGQQIKHRGVAQFFPSRLGLQDAIKSAQDIVQGNDDYVLAYNLNVAAATKEGAKTTARAFVRAKNLFEPTVIDIENVRQTSGGIVTDLWMNKTFEPAQGSGNSSGGNNESPFASIADTYSVEAYIRK